MSPIGTPFPSCHCPSRPAAEQPQQHSDSWDSRDSSNSSGTDSRSSGNDVRPTPVEGGTPDRNSPLPPFLLPEESASSGVSQQASDPAYLARFLKLTDFGQVGTPSGWGGSHSHVYALSRVA